MTRYHVNPEGNPGVCRATRSCPFGGDDQHYSSKQEAREAYERRAEVTDTIRRELRRALVNSTVDFGSYDFGWIETAQVGSDEWRDEIEWLQDAVSECEKNGDTQDADTYASVLYAVKEGETQWVLSH